MKRVLRFWRGEQPGSAGERLNVSCTAARRTPGVKRRLTLESLESRRILAADGFGIFDPAAGLFHLRNTPTTGFADISFATSPGNENLVPLSGDWDGDLLDTPGIYDKATGQALLWNELEGLNPATAIQFVFGPGGDDWLPLSGDFNGDGYDTLALYHSPSGVFFLKHDLQTGFADEVFVYGPGGQHQFAFGDWDGNGSDTPAMFDTAGQLFLRNTNNTGFADSVLSVGAGTEHLLAGDWDADGDDTPGLYDRLGVFRWKTDVTNGPAEHAALFGTGGDAWTPFKGNWQGRALPEYELDPTFGDGGVVKTRSVVDAADYAKKVLVQPDGKVVVLLRSEASRGIGLHSMARLLPDGRLDPTFGENGIAALDFGVVTSFTIDAGGTYTLVGVFPRNDGTGTYLARINALGDRISTYDPIVPHFSQHMVYTRMTSDALGRTVIMSHEQSLTQPITRFHRFHADGSVDTSFGDNGVAAFLFTSLYADGWNLQTTSPDRGIVAGYLSRRELTPGSGLIDITTVIRLKEDGSLDSEFGDNGEVFLPRMAGFDIILDAQGRTYLSGRYVGDGIHRILADGTIDTTWGTSGVLTLGDVRYSNMLPSPQGGLIVSMYKSDGDPKEFSVVVHRYDGSGQLDLHWGSEGTTEISTIRPMDHAFLASSIDGSRYLLGFGAEVGPTADVGMIALRANGAVDTNWGTTGVTVIDAGGGLAHWSIQVHEAADGSLLATLLLRPSYRFGFWENLRGFPVIGLKYMPDGSRDLNFGEQGVSHGTSLSHDLTTSAKQGDTTLFAMATGSMSTLYRILPGGEIDPTFGNGGKLEVVGVVASMSALADKRIALIVHSTSPQGGAGTYSLHLLRPNGESDTQFGENGQIALSGFRHSALSPDAVTLTADHGIAVAWLTNDGSTSRLPIILKFLANGQPDVSFGNGGITELPKIQDDSYIVINDLTEGADASLHVAIIGKHEYIACVHASGVLDTRFGSGGLFVIPRTERETFNYPAYFGTFEVSEHKGALTVLHRVGYTSFGLTTLAANGKVYTVAADIANLPAPVGSNQLLHGVTIGKNGTLLAYGMSTDFLGAESYTFVARYRRKQGG